MRDLPTSGIEPVSPALAGSFLTIGRAGKSYYKTLISGFQASFLQSRKISSLSIVTWRTHTHTHAHTPSHSHTEIADARLTSSYRGDLRNVSRVFFNLQKMQVWCFYLT